METEKLVKKCNNCVCAVAVCKSRKTESIIFHRFPKDTVRQKQWAHACKRDDRLLNPQTALVCSLHFQPSDYERDLPNELLGLPVRKRLKKSAVPTLKLHYLDDNKPSTALLNRQSLREKLDRKEVIQELMKTATVTAELNQVIIMIVSMHPIKMCLVCFKVACFKITNFHYVV